MARVAGSFVERSFTGGLVSEATSLNFPENACVDAQDCRFEVTGEVTRRKGWDAEGGYSWTSTTVDSSVFKEFIWDNVGGIGDDQIIVQQVGNTIYFFAVDPNEAFSSQRYGTTINLEDYKVAGAPSTKTEYCSFTTGKGYLFVAHKYCDPFYVSFDSTAEDFSATSITIEIRDFEGVEDTLELDERPTTLSVEHEYNLRNQGWPKAVTGSTTAAEDTIPYFFTSYYGSPNKYPSNADVWFLFKDSLDRFTAAGSALYNSIPYAPAPKGYYILEAFNIDRDAASALTGVPSPTTSYYRPQAIGFFAGRVFYAGTEDTENAGQVFFSKIIEGEADFGKCYQVQDPTHESFSDLLPTDGGVVKILGAGTVLSLFSTQKALIVFATNGIFAIGGTDASGFKANDFQVSKIASLNFNSVNGLVDVVGAPVFFNTDGIWTIEYGAGDFVLKSISDGKVKRFLETIPYASKVHCKGAYNREKRTVYWLYRSTAPSTADEENEFDRLLVLDMRGGAMYPFTFPDATVKVKGLFSLVALSAGNSNNVIDGSSNNVVDAAANQVVSLSTGNTLYSEEFRFTFIKPVSGTTYNLSFAGELSPNYLDWESFGYDEDYSSYFVSGYRVHADGNKAYQANYLTLYAKNETGAGANIQGIWDYWNTAGSKKWSTAEAIYFNATSGQDYHIRKVKIRGWGKSLQFKVTSDTGKPFNITGWSSFETANNLP